MIKLKLTILISFILLSCNSPKFYKEIESLNEKRFKDKTSSNFKSLKLIERHLKKTNHIVFYSSSSPNILTPYDNYNVIYDINNNKYYYIDYINRKIKLDKVLDSIDNTELYNEILNFRENKCDTLKLMSKKFPNETSLSSFWIYVYEIDLKNIGNNKKCNFEGYFKIN